jgi:hypothetical protein
VYLCGGSSQMPAVRDAVQKFFGVPIHAGVPPEQAVCLGAAIHASLIAARRSSPSPAPATTTTIAAGLTAGDATPTLARICHVMPLAWALVAADRRLRSRRQEGRRPPPTNRPSIPRSQLADIPTPLETSPTTRR